jgi:hypothetical protein
MRIPDQPPEVPGDFRPPHCPNPDCAFHIPNPQWRFVHRGSHRLHGRRVQNFQCRHCGRVFSPPTFSTTYFLKRPELLIPVAQLISEGMCLRQAARTLRTSHATVARLLVRLARQGMLFQRHSLQHFTPCEPIAADGFITFAGSQFFPFHVNIAAGSASWLVYHFTDAPVRRSGSMTDEQRRIRAELEAHYGRPDPKAVEKSMTALLKPLVAMLPPGEPLVLQTDDHRAYPRSLQRLKRQVPDCPVIDHRVTSSTEPRTKRNPLFPVNLTDLLLRHGSANHRRETLAFSKRRLAAMRRVAVFAVWRNFIKRQRENQAGPVQTAAMYAGVIDRALSWAEVLAQRQFPGQIELPPEWAGYYWGRIEYEVPGMHPPASLPKFAF